MFVVPLALDEGLAILANLTLHFVFLPQTGELRLSSISGGKGPKVMWIFLLLFPCFFSRHVVHCAFVLKQEPQKCVIRGRGLYFIEYT